MNTIDFLQKACSKDAYRPNLSRIYKDKETLVSTDGHRLHYVRTEPSELKGFLDGYDGEFPEYKQVFLAEKTEVIISFGSDDYKKLKALTQVAKTESSKIPVGTICLTDDTVIFGAKTKDMEASFAIKRDKKSEDWKPIEVTKITINLAYLLDAVSPLTQADWGRLTIGVKPATNSLVEITCHVPSLGLYHAVVMPMKAQD
jgi:DNA polymerase III sliding clamp (beta) subunit (PCNA family)